MTASSSVRIDYNAMMAETVGPERGLTPEALTALVPELERIKAMLARREGPGSDFLGFLDLPYQHEEALDAVIQCADRLAELGDRHLVLGIGGSYLGARAILEALEHPYRNELSRTERRGRPRISFEGNNLDADAMAALLAMLPEAYAEGVENGVTMNVISKSGGTVETAVAFRLFRQRLEQIYGENAASFIVATTDGAKGTLKNLADRKGYQQFVIPDDVGGRYSVLTPVGLLPAAVAGVDIKALVAGARAMAERCKAENVLTSPAYVLAALYHLSYRAGRDVALMAAWSKRLEYVGFWYDQLAAESLGKGGGGRVPLTSVNTRDLHARGQQVQEGPYSTVVTNLALEHMDAPLAVPPDAEDLDGLNYLAGWELERMQRGALEGTRYAYAKAGRPSLTVTLPKLDAFTLGEVFYLFELATLVEGHLQGVNPLDQPGVEEYKKFMFGNLGRPDMARYKEEFEARPKGSDAYRL